MPYAARKAGTGALAAAIVAAGLVGLAYAGGVAPAASEGPASADQYGPQRVTICHKAGRRYRTITIARSALAAHLRHGDTPGPCATRLNGAVSTRVTLTVTSGRRVTRIRRGTYWVVVTDRSRAANFHLTGPRVNRATTQRFRGTRKWRVRFLRGTYRYRADVGAVGGGTFRVR
jgi:hypothetical protein